MLNKYLHNATYILALSLFIFSTNSFANYIPNKDDGDILLTYKSKSDHKLCNEKDFYLSNIDISLSKDGILSVSMNQLSKSSEGFNTHLTIELIDYKGRVLTDYKTPTLAVDNEEAGLDKKTIKQNRKIGRITSSYFTENFKYQFSAEEYRIFIKNVRKINVKFNGCDAPNDTPVSLSLSRYLPKEIVDEFIHSNTPLVSE